MKHKLSLLFGCVVAICLVCAIRFAPVKRLAAVPKASAAPAPPDLYAPALERARDRSQDDGLAAALKIDSKVSLDGARIKNLNQLSVASNGDLYIVDYERKQAEAYDREGRYLGPLGEQGNKPGAQLWPTGAAAADGQTVAVADFAGHRVNTFTREGKFLSSFIYTPQGFSAQKVVYDGAGRSFYLLGNRWQRDEAGQVTGAQLVHKYAADGQFIDSYLPFPDSAKALDLYNYDSPAADADRSSLYVALPFDYTIYRLAPDGQLSVFVRGQEPAFRAPSEGINVEKIPPAESYRRIQNWRLGWTPISALVVSGDTLLVQYQSFNPLRYTIDFWSIEKRKKLRSVNTNCALLTKGQDGYLYLLENLEAKGQQRYDIIRAKL